jgi:AraC-like DNA-binding protein
LPAGYWGITAADLHNFDLFCTRVTGILKTLITQKPDSRKQQLFELIYSSKGSLTVKELSAKVFWSSRQINRYFNQQFGLSLKVYCNILRFRASLEHIKSGKLFPEENFTDQAHFIREVKKYAGVTPGELFKNKNDRFIQFSARPKQ